MAGRKPLIRALPTGGEAYAGPAPARAADLAAAARPDRARTADRHVRDLVLRIRRGAAGDRQRCRRGAYVVGAGRPGPESAQARFRAGPGPGPRPGVAGPASERAV